MDDGFIAFFGIFAVFGTITAIILGPNWLRSREKREMQATLRHAIDKGQDLPAEVIDALTKDVARNLPSRSRDIRRGVIWLAVGVGLAAFGLVNDLGDQAWERGFDSGLLGVACIPITIGIAFIVLSFFNPNKD